MRQERTHAPIETPARSAAGHRADSGVGGERAALARSTILATISVSEDGRIVDANQRMCDLLGARAVDELAGRTLNGDLLADAAGWRIWHRARREGFVGAATLQLNKLSGGVLELTGDIHAAPASPSGPFRLTGFFVDVTPEKRFRAAMKRSARMEALAALTSGIAHDVNNLLTVLVGNLYLVAEDVRPQPALLKKVKAARDAARRGSELTRRLLSFARGDSGEAGVTDPAKVIGRLVPLLRRAVGKRIGLEAHVAEGCGTVTVSAAELESAIVNLVINARDAIDAEGCVTVSVSSQVLNEAGAAARGVPAGEYVLIEVSDDGAGIAPEVIDRVFEPFFSTKKDRGGTGLGMSMVRWLAEQAGGGVRVESEVGTGTTVTMLLPASNEQISETGSRTMPLSTLPAGTETVLVLAADEALRRTMHELLVTLGYTTYLSAAPAEMMDRLQRQQVDLLVMDATSPGHPSVETLLQRALSLAPAVKVVVATSGAESVVGRLPRVPVMLKPFSLFEFATTVRRALDGAENG